MPRLTIRWATTNSMTTESYNITRELIMTEDDPFDSLLGLEDHYYQEGYELGVKHGTQAGLIEGRLFGLEKGYEKYAAIGKLHGQSTVWAARLSSSQNSESNGTEKMRHKSNASDNRNIISDAAQMNSESQETIWTGEHGHGEPSGSLLNLTENSRLVKHIRTLYALVEPSSLSTENNEESVSVFDDRLKRAEGKVKIIEKMVGEHNATDFAAEPVPSTNSGKLGGQVEKGEASIEDLASLHAKP